ncbi:sensor histidine kinase [Lichenihabitans sp. Uapishka_5]|uniref:sensor histidine kinase n=1 Tax=Lichenihabitans sp. Uapishka_5 TaxID=3037302 RepID=UPI0029E80EC6|nr:sensor histidine kinase [Lichenihabitans sp. Uapishka_5]MDX7951772.1 sensor histidine kinase [Lichenihabitans sp. Uapishka_5]
MTLHEADASAATKAAFNAEVAGRFGLVPNFFQSASEAPGLIAELWGFAKSAYIFNPLPSLFKERLFVHVSRFCEVRYCIVRHVGFLVGNGQPAGDPKAHPQTVDDVVELLRKPGVPDAGTLDAILLRLEARNSPFGVPEAGTQEEFDIFAAASIVFLHPTASERARGALRAALGAQTLEFLTAFLAFIRTAHYWTETHPDIVFEEDMEELMRLHEELASLMLDTKDAARTEVGQRLYDEVILLRQERDDRVALRKSLAENQEARRHQQLLINELNHRVKNTLAIIQSIAMQTLRDEDITPQIREAFMARLMALADAHDVLTAESWDGAELDAVITKAAIIHQAAGGNSRFRLSGPPIRLTPKTAVALSMAFHELATNAAKYGALSVSTGKVDVDWSLEKSEAGDRLSLCWTERAGPYVMGPARKGFGSRLIERGLAGELAGDATLDFRPDGLVCTIHAPYPFETEIIQA